MGTIFLTSRFPANTVVHINPDTTLSVFFSTYLSDNTQQKKENSDIKENKENIENKDNKENQKNRVIKEKKVNKENKEN